MDKLKSEGSNFGIKEKFHMQTPQESWQWMVVVAAAAAVAAHSIT